MDDEGLTVGQLATASGLTVRALHHYDRIGLLAPSGRTGGGHRRYSDADVARLYRIVALRQLGAALPQIAAVLSEEEPVVDLLQRQLAETTRSIRAHQELLARLQRGLAASNLGAEELFGVIGGTLELDPPRDEGVFRPTGASARDLLSTFLDGFDSAHARLRSLLGAIDEATLHRSGAVLSRTVGDSVLGAVGFEDRFVQGVLQSRPSIFDDQGWAGRLGVDSIEYGVRLPTTAGLADLRGYAEAVFDATTACVTEISDEELIRDIPGPGATALTWSMKVSELLAQVGSGGLQAAGYAAAVLEAVGCSVPTR